MIDVVRAGFSPAYLPYDRGLELQRSVHGEVVDGSRPDTLILAEHESVFTAGKRTEPHERPTDGTPVIDADRGGKITWHGPGQLTGYPIVRLREPVDVVAYVRQLEQLMIDVLAPFDIDGVRIAGRSGVWTTGRGAPAKIGAIGVRVADGVTMHGFALNCSNSLEPFSRIVPCGISDAAVTTVSELIGTTVDPIELADDIAERFDAIVAAWPAVRAIA